MASKDVRTKWAATAGPDSGPPTKNWNILSKTIQSRSRRMIRHLTWPHGWGLTRLIGRRKPHACALVCIRFEKSCKALRCKTRTSLLVGELTRFLSQGTSTAIGKQKRSIFYRKSHSSDVTEYVLIMKTLRMLWLWNGNKGIGRSLRQPTWFARKGSR